MKLIKISAMWCPACLIMRSLLSDLENEINIEQVEYDYDLDEAVVKDYNVGEILPVLILVDSDKEIARLVGEKSKEEVLNFLRSNVK